MAVHEDGDDRTLQNGGSEKGSPVKSDEDTKYKLPWRTWLQERFSWSWFTCTQSTGGIAIALYECPKTFPGLRTIGSIIFIFEIVLYLLFTSLMLLRWKTNPSKIVKCFTAAPECYFFGSYLLSSATIIINMRYGVPHAGPWLVDAIRVCFWIYAAISLLITMIHFVVICRYAPFVAIQFAPPIFLLFLNAMLTGTVAASIAGGQPPEQRLPIIVAGVAFQGSGWITCLLLLPWFVANLMEKGWPPALLRPGLFITVGTSGFTIVALMGLARAAQIDYGYFAVHPIAAEVVLIVATWAGIFMWLFSFWLFGIAFCIFVLGLFSKKDGKWRLNLSFNNTWWSKFGCISASLMVPLLILLQLSSFQT